ncbi:MAG TPA: hypothetical protein PKC18_03480 [Lacipirellulaceae bacterium]|nr:hypothetical protein [Lacipirellulaceae bacterium]HMP05688.1 hypothetical protein [Lacipirellulaceae bacterium]
MKPSPAELMTPRLTTALDGLAEWSIRLPRSTGDDVASVAGTLEGPYCIAARTLPTTFSLRDARVAAEGEECWGVQIVDPCYWTPRLPFIYRLRAQIAWKSGQREDWEQSVALRRFEARGQSFYWDRKRVVLRGALLPNGALSALDEADRCGATLIVPNPSFEFCEHATRRGVSVIADLREAGRKLLHEMRQLAWQGAVLAAIVDANQLESAADIDGPMLIEWVHLDSGPVRMADDGRRPMIVSLEPGRTPPAELAVVHRPMIAVSHRARSRTVAEARDSCDNLQAELAPAFDLAGYFFEAS